MKSAKKALRFDRKTAEEAWKTLPGDEKEYLREMISALCQRRMREANAALECYAVTRYRAGRKAAEDARRDREKRVLVGARLDRETAERIRAAAQVRGESLYRFVTEALREKAEETLGFVSF